MMYHQHQTQQQQVAAKKDKLSWLKPSTWFSSSKKNDTYDGMNYIQRGESADDDDQADCCLSSIFPN
jgi:hypothetical protein